MDGAFFLSRTELLNWTNQVLSLGLTKIEQCGNGAVYCQLIDLCHEGVPMKRVNWLARCTESISNYKILQVAFQRNNIEKNIDVEKLMLGRFQDHIEFLQWIKRYCGRCGERDGYSSHSAREGRHLPSWACPVCAQTAQTLHHTSKKFRVPSSTEHRTVPETPAIKGVSPANCSSTERKHGVVVEDATPCDVAELRAAVHELERERDHYFQKLREVEIFCATMHANMAPGTSPEKVVADIEQIIRAESHESSFCLSGAKSFK